MLGADLASLTLGELLGATLSSVCLGERQAYLEQSPSEVPNGFYQRKVNVGSLAVPLRVPRTRNADFRPQVLPKRYERLEHWKEVLRNLLDRGLRRVLLFVQDAFTGLARVTESLFPQSHTQLCVVHILRNARQHLSKQDLQVFLAEWKGIRDAWDPEIGAQRFEQLCQRFEPDYPTWIRYLRRNRTRYLAFLEYPSAVRPLLRTTNTVEAVNGQLEILRRNSGGYFQSQRSLRCKLALSVRRLQQERWKSPLRKVCGEVQRD